MQPRFLGQLGLADAVTVANAALGFVATAVAFSDPALATRLVLLAAIADGLDGVVARVHLSTPVGEYLDSLADVASFGVAPAVLVYAVAIESLSVPLSTAATSAVFAIPALYVGAAVVRLGFYMLHDRETPETEGVQTTLGGTLLAVAYLAGVTDPVFLLGATLLLAYLMVASITYPELYARDAVILGSLQAVAVLFPTAWGRLFPKALLVFAVGYLVFGPVAYWRDAEAEPPRTA